METYIILFLIAGASIFIGGIIGFLLTNAQYKKGLYVVIVATIRILTKSIHRIGKGIDSNKKTSDEKFKSLFQDIKKNKADPHALYIALSIKNWLLDNYSSEFVSLYLYGSRARGDFDENSDIDVGIYMKNMQDRDFRKIKQAIMPYTFSLIIEHGCYVQLRFYDSRILTGKLESTDYLAKAAFSYGISI